jgi:hypothetical protein
MKPISKNRKSRSLFWLDPPSCALPPKKARISDPESVPTAIIFYFNQSLQATLPSFHQAHGSIAHVMPSIHPIQIP